MTDDLEAEILTGIAQLLADEDLGFFSDTDSYPADQVGIFIGLLRQQPDAAFAVSGYDYLESLANQGDDIFAINIRVRAPGDDVRAAWSMTGAARRVLHDRTHFDVSGHRISESRRISIAPVEFTDSGVEQSSNFHLLIPRPAL